MFPRLRLIWALAAAAALAACGTTLPNVQYDGKPWPTWPTDYAPDDCPVTVYNEITVQASPEVVWGWLARGDLWPLWFKDATDFHYETPAPMAQGTRMNWNMLGADIHVEVMKFQPPVELDWQGGAGGVHAYHAWLLIPFGTGTRVVTVETEHGPLPFFLRWYLRGALHDAHQHWVEGLAQQSLDGPAPPPGELPRRK